jgi:hypothetical protein
MSIPKKAITRTLLAWFDLPSIIDWLLGWTLHLPRDLTLMLVVILTVGIVLFIRKRCTAQERLARVKRDLAQLRRLRSTARAAGDQHSVQRLDTTATQLKLLTMRADLVVLAWAIVPLGLLAWWASARLPYYSPKTDDELTITASYSASSVDRLTYLVPHDGYELLTPAIQRVAIGDEAGSVARVSWKVRVTAKEPCDVPLVIQHLGDRVEHSQKFSSVQYREPYQTHPKSSVLSTEVSLREYRFLGLVPGINAWGIYPWMMAYLALTLVLMPIARRLLGIA